MSYSILRNLITGGVAQLARLSPLQQTLSPTKPSIQDTIISSNKNLGDTLNQIPFVFLSSLNNLQSTNVANNVLIMGGVPVPTGYYGVATDFNVIFVTVAGTVKLAVMDWNFQNKISDYQTGLTNSSNGQGALKLDQNQSLCLLGQTAGAGTVNVYCSGYIKKATGLIQPQV